MKVDTFTEIRSKATEKWKEYRKAFKAYSNNSLYKELAKIYYQLANGKTCEASNHHWKRLTTFSQE